MRAILWRGYWSKHDLEENPRYLFVFGDNNVQQGKRGQAVIRDCVNAAGIPTKKMPNNRPSSFYSDDDFEENCSRIRKAVEEIRERAKQFECVVLPEDGLGTGLAQLSVRAPRTFQFLQDTIDAEFKILSNLVR